MFGFEGCENTVWFEMNSVSINTGSLYKKVIILLLVWGLNH